MGGVVKAITKPFKSVIGSIGKVVGGVLGTNQARTAAPQVIQQAAPTPAAQAQVQTTQAPTEDSQSGESSERSARRGKKSLTIRRTNVGGGSGLNV